MESICSCRIKQRQLLPAVPLELRRDDHCSKQAGRSLLRPFFWAKMSKLPRESDHRGSIAMLLMTIILINIIRIKIMIL